MQEQNISGYFVAFANEAKELEDMLKRNEPIKTGRLGIFYKKEKLIEKLEEQTALKKKKMIIVKVSVPKNAILRTNEKTNEEKFGFIKNKVCIMCLEEFGIKKMAVA